MSKVIKHDFEQKEDCQCEEDQMKVIITEYDEGFSIHLQEEGDTLDVKFGKYQLEHEFGKPVELAYVEFKDGKPALYYLFKEEDKE